MSTVFERDQYVQLKSINDIDSSWVAGIPHSWVIKACEKPIKITGISPLGSGETMLLLQSEDFPLSYFVNAKAVKSIIGKLRRENVMENRALITCWQEVHTIIDDAMEKRDRTVSVFINPVTGMSITVHPWPDVSDLWDMYQKGEITKNDLREMIGLPRMKGEDTYAKPNFLDKELQIPKE